MVRGIVRRRPVPTYLCNDHVVRHVDEMGRGQAVRRGTLNPVFEGSNPSAPTMFSERVRVSECRRTMVS